MRIGYDCDNRNAALPSFEQLHAILGGRARADGVCPLCSPHRQRHHQKLRVLRVWRGDNPAILIFNCVHCQASGYRVDGQQIREADRAAIERARREAEQCQQTEDEQKRSAARSIWSRREPLAGSIAETYLRATRKIMGPLPACLHFLPAFDRDGPALVAPFGMPLEVEPGELQWPATRVSGVQRIFLTPEAKKLGKPISRGVCRGEPIALAPFTDANTLIIAEGIEDALTAHAATGLAAWAAGGASFMPALADSVPAFVEHITVLTDRDPSGLAGARALVSGLRACGLDVRQIWSAP